MTQILTFSAPENVVSIHRQPSSVELVIVGATGKVGRALVRQLRDAEPPGLRLRILANSRFTNDSRACSAVVTDWPSTLSTVDAGSIFIHFCENSVGISASASFSWLLFRSSEKLRSGFSATGAGSPAFGAPYRSPTT